MVSGESIKSVDRIQVKLFGSSPTHLSYFTRWVNMARIEKKLEGLADLILRDQLAFLCNKELELFLKKMRT